jgi:hypothetical protein
MDSSLPTGGRFWNSTFPEAKALVSSPWKVRVWGVQERTTAFLSLRLHAQGTFFPRHNSDPVEEYSPTLKVHGEYV